ncbi:MAG: polyprenol monophosphomannose synthase [Planctomyces sp.]
MRSLLITLCTYNERGNIERLIPELLAIAPDADVLVVDDKSPDGTGALADQLARDNSRVYTIHRPKKLGLGSATLCGFQYGIENGYSCLINMDADFSHRPEHIPAMRALMSECDVVIGSRYIHGGKIIGWSRRRHLMSRMINGWARICLGLKTRDNSGSFRCYRVELLKRIDWSKAVSRGFGIPEEILYRCQMAGCRFLESPITFEDRQVGFTKINVRESLRAAWNILQLGIHRLRGVPVTRQDHSVKVSSDRSF